jgi:hypothetical protein
MLATEIAGPKNMKKPKRRVNKERREGKGEGKKGKDGRKSYRYC